MAMLARRASRHAQLSRPDLSCLAADYQSRMRCRIRGSAGPPPACSLVRSVGLAARNSSPPSKLARSERLEGWRTVISLISVATRRSYPCRGPQGSRFPPTLIGPGAMRFSRAHVMTKRQLLAGYRRARSDAPYLAAGRRSWTMAFSSFNSLMLASILDLLNSLIATPWTHSTFCPSLLTGNEQMSPFSHP